MLNSVPKYGTIGAVPLDRQSPVAGPGEQEKGPGPLLHERAVQREAPINPDGATPGLEEVALTPDGRAGGGRNRVRPADTQPPPA